ncbi:MAG TPA: relaxase/mobilization nuclease domain-containing protein, partial [Sphingobacteriaceae bacterium]
QPYLVYKHLDTAHPHLHIVSTNIDRAGKNIDFYFRCLGKSFKAARALEQKYGLQYAYGPRETPLTTLVRPPVEYGISEIRNGISDVVKEVTDRVRVTNLADFNLVLSQYNVLADRGSETSEMYKNGGLLYRATRDGKRIGVPVKASSIDGKPTLRLLQSLFLRNEAVVMDRKAPVLKRLDAIICTNTSQGAFLTSLRSMGISVVLHYSDGQELRDITYIDNYVGAVFSGNDLGKVYGAAELSARFSNFREVLPGLRAAGSGPEGTRSYICCAVRDGHNWKSLRESQDERLKKGLRISL